MKGATAVDFYERFVVDDVPNYNPESPKRLCMHVNTEIGSLKLDQVFTRHFSVSKGDLNLNYNSIIEVDEVPQDKVGFYMLDCGRGHIPLFGETKLSDSGGSVNVGECYVAFNPGLSEIHRFDAQSAKPFYLEINGDYFASLLDSGDVFTGNLKEKILKREFFGMKTSMVSAQYLLASSIYDCPLEGALGNLMVEGSVQQFVALQLSTFVRPVKSTNITSRDRDILHAVKDYLHRTFHMNHTLIDLSKQFGINQNKLKKSFKELFGVPVIEYLYDLKMEQAKIMLYEQGMYVREVSSIVGYKNPNHFATAFKRKFGVRPSKI
jgi:AraC-like DNA-binding protein